MKYFYFVTVSYECSKDYQTEKTKDNGKGIVSLIVEMLDPVGEHEDVEVYREWLKRLEECATTALAHELEQLPETLTTKVLYYSLMSESNAT